MHKARGTAGLSALYFAVLCHLGVLTKKREPNPKRVYFLFREDIRHMQNIAREARLLVKHSIDTDVQLAGYKASVATEMTALSGQRKRLRNQTRTIKDEDKLAAVKSEIAIPSDKIGELRREVGIGENIETSTGVIKEKLHRARDDEKAKGKEQMKHEPLRRRR